MSNSEAYEVPSYEGRQWWKEAVVYQVYPAPSTTRTATASVT